MTQRVAERTAAVEALAETASIDPDVEYDFSSHRKREEDVIWENQRFRTFVRDWSAEAVRSGLQWYIC